MTENSASDDAYWFSLGEAERDRGQFRQAELCFQKAVELNPYKAVY